MKSETNYYPGCHVSSAGKRKPHQICEHLKEMLETRATCENLHRELDRRENRNDNLMKELQTVRQAQKDTQRELQILKGMFDKVSLERRQLSAELAESKEYGYKLEIQVSRMQNSTQLISDISSTRTEADQLRLELDKRVLELDRLKEKCRSSEKEIETLNRSLDSCVFYQGSKNQTRHEISGGISGEKMRNIYYELGKRQAEIHALSLSLSEANKELATLREDNEMLSMSLQGAQGDLTEIRSNEQRLLQQTLRDGDTLGAITAERDSALEDCERLQKEVEKLSEEIERSRLSESHKRREQEVQVEALGDAVISLEEENRALKDRLESLHLSLRHRESVQALTEQRLKAESDRLEEEKKRLENSAEAEEVSKKQLDFLKTNLNNALEANDALARDSREAAAAHREALRAAVSRGDRFEQRCDSLESELKALRKELDVVMGEREEAAGALRRAITTARGLTVRVSEEQARREEAERKLQEGQQKMSELLRVKEQVSYAVLDALHRERVMQNSSSSKSPGRTSSGEETVTEASKNYSVAVDDKRTAHEHWRYFTSTYKPHPPALPTSGSANNTPVARSPLYREVPPTATSDLGRIGVGQKRPEPSPFKSDAEHARALMEGAGTGSIRENLIGDLKRLKQEVDLLDQESKSGTLKGEKRYNSSSESGASTPQHLGRDDRSTSSSNSSTSDTRRSHPSTPATADSVKHIAETNASDPSGPHSLFDLMSLDPRVAFANSAPTTPSKPESDDRISS